MPLICFNHFTVLTNNLSITTTFYCDVLDLKTGYRPKLGFPGEWLYLGNQAILHLIETDKIKQNSGTSLDHIAFTGNDLSEIVNTLKHQNITFMLKQQKETEIWQLFFNDPNGVKIELNFFSNNLTDND